MTCAREQALLGDYDGAIGKFKQIFSTVHHYAKRYESSPATPASSSGAGYAAQTASSAKKSSAKHAA